MYIHGVSCYFSSFISFFLIFFNVYLFLRQRETEHEWGRVRERETQNPKQAPGSEPSAQSPTRGPHFDNRCSGGTHLIPLVYRLSPELNPDTGEPDSQPDIIPLLPLAQILWKDHSLWNLSLVNDERLCYPLECQRKIYIC